MKSVNVCIPVLKRYDLLRKALDSLRLSSVLPEAVYIIDNGQVGERLLHALELSNFPFRAKVHTPKIPLGVAASWNWFIRNVPEERVISNDDVLFGVHSLEKMVGNPADLVWAEGCGFSCFVIRNTCIAKLGLFDEEISPGYAYYEDDDYLQRLDGRGTREPSAIAANVAADILHTRSSTLAGSSPEELNEHHRKFKIAQANYAKKWNIPMEAFR